MAPQAPPSRASSQRLLRFQGAGKGFVLRLFLNPQCQSVVEATGEGVQVMHRRPIDTNRLGLG